MWRSRISSVRFTHNELYTLARKFQIEENIRSLLLARKLVISAVIFISGVCSLLICLVFEWTHGYDTFFVYALDNSILLPALVMSVTLLFCSPAWRERFIVGIPGIQRFRDSRVTHLAENAPKISANRETEVYFEQLRNAWI
uniref:Serpentine receptor class gamma n=1 Tax=Caenorhabditis tropicalis TaxID=1561998 RepID=A0A1I7U3N0_9PELO